MMHIELLFGSDRFRVRLNADDAEAELSSWVPSWLEGHQLRVSWEDTLALLDAADAEDRRRAELLEALPPMSISERELLEDLVDAPDFPPCTALVLRPKIKGISGRAGFTIVEAWEGLKPVEHPMREGGLITLPDGGQARLTLGQYRALQLIDRQHVGTGDRDADERVKAELQSVVPRGDPGVQLERQFQLKPRRSVTRVAPRVEREGNQYRLRPRAREVDDGVLAEYFRATAPERLGDDRFEVRNPETGKKERVVFQESAKRGLVDLEKKKVLDEEQVAEAISRPERFFGPDLDTSGLSERVTGLGPPVRRVFPSLKEIKGASWWDWDVVATTQSIDDDGAPDVPFSLKDPAVREKVRSDIERADAAGRTVIPHPTEPGSFIPIEVGLRNAVGQAETLTREAAKSSTGRLSKPPKQVLQVGENVEALAFERARAETPVEALPFEAPPHLQTGYALKPHQEEGYMWLRRVLEGGGDSSWRGGLLADDMGLGKTLQVLSLLSWAKAQGHSGPHLIVAPVALLENWQQEAARFFGASLEPIFQVSSRQLPSDPAAAAARLSSQHLVLVSYETLKRHELSFARVDFGYVILDEAQKAKDPATQIARVVRTLKARARLAMTGTPVENSLKELWTLIDWALPGLLGTFREFSAEYIKPIRDDVEGTRTAELASQLQRVLAPILLRRMKSEVLTDLPELTRRRVETGLSAKQFENYDRLVRAEQAPLGKLTGLFGICAHPSLTSKSPTLPSLDTESFPKGAKLFEILDEIRGRGEKAIVFANRKSTQRWIADEAEHRFGLEVDIINGQINDSKTRLQTIDRFSAADGFGVLVLAPRAAGVGLNITAANHVIHYMREWNPAIENQATDRAYRMGQTRPVEVYTIITTHPGARTVEERLDVLLEQKRALMGQFIVPMGDLGVRQDEILE